MRPDVSRHAGVTVTEHGELDFQMTSEIPDLHGVLARLRSEAPVVEVGTEPGHAFIVLTHEHLRAALRDEESFPSEASYSQIMDPAVGRSLNAKKGEEHHRNRAIISPSFRRQHMTMVEFDRLRDRVAALVVDWNRGASVVALEPLVGGRSSLTYLVALARGATESAPIVVKMAPPGLPPTRNRDVLRQARVQDALFGSGRVPVAPVLFTDEGDPPAVPPLFAMEFMEGESFEPLLDQCDALPAPAEIRGRQRSAARILGRLHALTPAELGLAEEPEVDLGEEVLRWVRIFETLTDDLRPGFEQCSETLLAAVPTPVPSTVVHGEYRLGNTLARDDEVTAVIDWELWCREDPRVDLSWFLQYADSAQQPSAIRATPEGMPSRAELLEVYEQELGRAVTQLSWFDAHARFKMAAITGLTSKHNRKRDEPDPAQEARVPLIAEFLAQAHRLVLEPGR